jgi:tetratricopeptide (TPR) repeat protein
MKSRNLLGLSATVVLAAVALTLGCQSVATTSAKLRNQEGNYDLAIDLCRQALAQNPDDAEAYFQLGVAYSQLDSVALAYQNFKRAVEIDPKKQRDADNNIAHNFAKHYKLGQTAFTRNDYEDAAMEFGLATDSDPSQAVAYYNLGVAYARLADDDPSYREKTVAAMDKVLELSNPSDANYTKALSVAGRQLVAMGRPKEAEERFRRLIEEDPTSYDVINDIGNDLLASQQWEGAAVFLKMEAEAREKIGAEDYTTYYNIGVALYNMRKKDDDTIDTAVINEAIAYYEKALAVAKDAAQESQTVFNIAVAYVAQGDYAHAVDWLEKYVKENSADPKGWQLLARCYNEIGDKTKGKEAFERFEQLRQ